MNDTFRPGDQFQRYLVFTVARITTTEDDSDDGSQGTGFIYGHVDGDSAVTFLITNKHVIENGRRRINVNFNRLDNESGEPILGDIVSFALDRFEEYYYAHPEEHVDLACVNISSLFNQEDRPYVKHIRDRHFESPNSGKFLVGDEVWFVGFPEGRFDYVNNLPITRRGFIASPPHVDYNGFPDFLIDAQVFPGSSGSPVFSIYENSARLIGVISDTLVRHEKLQSIPAKIQAGVEQVLGLGVVIKIEKVAELIEFALREMPILKRFDGIEVNTKNPLFEKTEFNLRVKENGGE